MSVYGKCGKSTTSIGGGWNREKLHILLYMTLSVALHLASNPRHYWRGTNLGGWLRKHLWPHWCNIS